MTPAHLTEAGPRVRIVGDHRSRWRLGAGRDDLPLTAGMWRIELDPGAHADACFAGEEHLRGLPLEEDPYA